MVSLLDIIGPVMVGPSSSHTAGACRLGLLARGLVGGTPERATIELHGSFARTGEGHGTDKAIVAGLMGFRPDDERIRNALEIAEREGLDYTFEKTTLDDEAHPEHGAHHARARRPRRGDDGLVARRRAACSSREIDGFPVEVSGNYHTIVLVAEDMPGSVARIATLLAEDGLNIATLRSDAEESAAATRSWSSSSMSIPTSEVRDHIRALPWVRWAFRLDKVSA